MANPPTKNANTPGVLSDQPAFMVLVYPFKKRGNAYIKSVHEPVPDGYVAEVTEDVFEIVATPLYSRFGSGFVEYPVVESGRDLRVKSGLWAEACGASVGEAVALAVEHLRSGNAE